MIKERLSSAETHQKSSRGTAVGASLNSRAGPTMPPLPSKSSSNRPVKGGGAVSREEAVPQPGDITVVQQGSRALACSASSQPTQEHSFAPDHLLCPIQQQAPGGGKPAPSPTEGKS